MDSALKLHSSQWGKNPINHSITQSLTEPDTLKKSIRGTRRNTKEARILQNKGNKRTNKTLGLLI